MTVNAGRPKDRDTVPSFLINRPIAATIAANARGMVGYGSWREIGGQAMKGPSVAASAVMASAVV